MNRRIRDGAVIALYVLVLAIVGPHLGTWTDEEYTLATSAHGFVYAWHRALDYEVQAPLYFGLIAVWRELNGSVWFARLFSIVCAGFFFGALIRIGRRVVPEREPLLFATIVACNPFVIWAAFEIRLYAFALAISAFLWLAIDAGFVNGREKRARAAFVVLAIVAIYTQYFLGFLLAAYAVVVVIRRERSTLFSYAIALALVSVACFPLVAYIHSQVGASNLSHDSNALLLRNAIAHPWLDFIFPYSPAWSSWHARLPYFGLLGLVTLVAALSKPRMTERFGFALVVLGIVQFEYLAVVLVVRLGLQPRHYIALYLPLMVAAYAAVVAIARRRPGVASAIVALHVVLAIGVLATTYRALSQDGDARRVGRFLTSVARTGDAIAIFPADALPAYARQYGGTVPLVPFPHEIPRNRYNETAISIHSERQASRALRDIASGKKRVWFVIEGECDFKRPFYGCDDAYDAARETHVLAEFDFYKAHVFELQIRASRNEGARAAPNGVR